MDKISNYKIRDLIYNKYAGKCAYCGYEIERNKFHIDHIKPKRRHLKEFYGTDELENYNPSCKSCNSSKGAFDLEDWRREISLKELRLFNNESNYRICLRFDLVKKTDNNVKFYFEKVEVLNG